MSDTHVPLDEKRNDKFLIKEMNDSFMHYFKRTQSIFSHDDVEKIVAQELAHLKHTICVEIEEKRKEVDQHYNPFDHASIHRHAEAEGWNNALDDALSVKSLKESE